MKILKIVIALSCGFSLALHAGPKFDQALAQGCNAEIWAMNCWFLAELASRKIVKNGVESIVALDMLSGLKVSISSQLSCQSVDSNAYQALCEVGNEIVMLKKAGNFAAEYPLLKQYYLQLHKEGVKRSLLVNNHFFNPDRF